jgi:YbbR domain-containing protein
MRRFFRKYVANNFLLKAVSLLAAVVLWFTVARDPMSEVPINVPIEFHHVPENLEISSESIPQAQIRVRGPQRIVRELRQAEIHAVIDLAGARAGERTYDLNPSQIRVPRYVEVVQIVPAQFRMSFDRRATRNVDVRPRVIGTFASGFHIAKVQADPPEIAVMGPEKRVAAIEGAITDPVDATGVVGRATFTTHAYVADPLVRVLNPGPIRVTVTTEKSASAGGAR